MLIETDWNAKVALITGAAGGVGRAAAEAFKRAGVRLLLSDINLKGTFFMCSRAIPELKKTRGCIVNIASDAGIQGQTQHTVYGAAKGGVVNMTRALALDLARDLVRVNAVCPSDIMTPMLEKEVEASGMPAEAYHRENLKSYPQGERARYLQPEEVADLILYLSSDSARGITGAAIAIDYGTSAGRW